MDPEKDITAPKKVKHVPPVYPPAAKEAGREGKVVIEMTITMSGKTNSLRVKESADPGLDQAAIEAVSQWEYSPSLVRGHPCPTILTVTVNFKL